MPASRKAARKKAPATTAKKKPAARKAPARKAPARKAAPRKAPAKRATRKAPATTTTATPATPDEKNKGGRPPLDIDPEQVERLSAIHCTHEEMAAVLGCSTDTLVRRFADRIEKGRERGKASLRRRQFEMAMAGDRTMLIWLGKQYLEQADKNEHTGRGGKPIETEHTEKRVYEWVIGDKTIQFE